MLISSVDDNCYEQSGTLCKWVYEQTDNNETLANLSDWFINIPLQILLVVVIALVLTRLSKRWVARLVQRLLAPKTNPTDHLGKVGIDVPDTFAAPPDPRRASRVESASVVLTSTIIVVIWVIASLMIFGIAGIQLAPL